MNSKYIQFLVRNVILVILGTALGVAAGTATILIERPIYQSTSQAFVSTQSAGSASDLSQSGTFAQQVVKSYAAVATSPLVLNKVAADLKMDAKTSNLASMVTATVPVDQVIVEITARAESPTLAANIANSVTMHLAQAVDVLTPSAQSETASIKITQIQTGEPASEAIEPNPVVDVSVGLLLGLAAGIFAGICRDVLSTTFRSPQQLVEETSLPLLGATRDRSRSARDGLTMVVEPRTPLAEAYRSLRTNLQFLDPDKSQHIFAVTSSIQGEGKSTTSANLAVAISEAGRRVLLIDSDLRRPRIAEYFGLDGSLGLSDVLISEAPVERALQTWGSHSLSILPAGTVPPNPSELLQSDRMQRLLANLATDFDVVIVDTPPLLAVSDAAIVAKYAGGALLVVSMNRTTRGQVAASRKTLHQLELRLHGVVATMVRRSRFSDDSYSYQYG